MFSSGAPHLVILVRLFVVRVALAAQFSRPRRGKNKWQGSLSPFRIRHKPISSDSNLSAPLCFFYQSLRISNLLGFLLQHLIFVYQSLFSSVSVLYLSYFFASWFFFSFVSSRSRLRTFSCLSKHNCTTQASMHPHRPRYVLPDVSCRRPAARCPSSLHTPTHATLEPSFVTRSLTRPHLPTQRKLLVTSSLIAQSSRLTRSFLMKYSLVSPQHLRAMQRPDLCLCLIYGRLSIRLFFGLYLVNSKAHGFASTKSLAVANVGTRSAKTFT